MISDPDFLDVIESCRVSLGDPEIADIVSVMCCMNGMGWNRAEMADDPLSSCGHQQREELNILTELRPGNLCHLLGSDVSRKNSLVCWGRPLILNENASPLSGEKENT